MPIKKIDSGVSCREIHEGFDKATEKAFQRLKDNTSLAKQLVMIERKARSIPAKYGVRDWPRGVPQSRGTL